MRDNKADRAATGRDTMKAIIDISGFEPATPFGEAARDFVFAEVWARPGLDHRSRRWIALSCVCAARSPIAIKTYVRAALSSGDISMAELREFVLQFAVFQGFAKAAEVEFLLDEIDQG